MMLATKAQYVYDLCFCLAIRIVIGFNRRTTLIQTFGSYLYIFENSFSLKIYQKLGHIKLNVWISQVPESCSAADVVELDCFARTKFKTLIQTSCFCRAFVEQNRPYIHGFFKFWLGPEKRGVHTAKKNPLKRDVKVESD